MSMIVQTSGGQISGVETGDGIVSWRGIPYAAAPLGALRWRLPQPVVPWTGVRDGSRPGSPAIQPPSSLLADLSELPDSSGPELSPPSEDCLHLNVTAPADATNAPVIVWIHGGGYRTGNGLRMAGDGVAFVRDHGVVVVTFNYRLGAFGFLSVPGEEHTGAFGLHDQIAALRWVRENIGAFGGDPARVTVYGLSAGAKSVANLMGSPLARGLFRQAAFSSGGGDHVASPAQTQALAARFLKEAGSAPERLRTIPAADILAAQRAIGEGIRATWIWRPAIDGLALTRHPLDAIADGSAAGVRLLAQHCVREGLLYQLLEPSSAAQADRVLEEYLGAEAREEILAAYAAAAPDQDPTNLRVDIMTAERYGIPTSRVADAQSVHAPVWRSRYDGPLSGLPPRLVPGGRLPAVHGSDGTAIWNGGDGVNGQMHAAWGAFVYDASPAAPELPPWPEYTRSDRSTMIFREGATHVEHDPDSGRRVAWDGRAWDSGTWYQIEGVF